MRVDLSRIGVRQHKELEAAISAILREAEKDPIYLSDLLVAHQQAEPLLMVLRKDPNRKYTIYQARDEWGNPPQPGMIVRRKFKHPLNQQIGPDTVPIPSSELNSWKRAGIYDQKRYYYEDYTLDAKGCFKVSAADAEYFLTQFGLHGISGMPLSYHAVEHSTEPVTAPDGQKYHVWYWRMKEMSKEMYDALPVLTIPAVGEKVEKQRGYK